jgi:DNA repair exonuclease SbcCD nuclease subunit
MIRRNNIINKIPDAIYTADWHLRETQPVCRTDNFVEETQWNKVDFISDLQAEYGCPVYHTGDLFDYWKPSPALLSKTIEHLPKQFYTVYGNHDLPQHNLELAYKSGLYTLEKSQSLNSLNYNMHINGLTIDGCSWNQYPIDCEKRANIQILVWHILTYQGKEPYPGCSDPKAAKLLRKYPQYNLIVTGDNHTPFVEEYEGRLLVNPGSIFRMDADQINHKPRVYLWYADTNTVKPIYLPIENNVISRDHIKIKEQRDNRIEAFVSQLNGDWQASMSFEDNIKVFEKKNNVRQSVMDIVYKSMEL